MRPKMATRRKSVTVRLPPDKYQALKAAAEAEGRSVSEEIEYRVQKAAIINEVLIALGLKPIDWGAPDAPAKLSN